MSFSLLYLGEPIDLKDETNPDWAPTQKMGHDGRVVVTASVQLTQKGHERAA